MKKIIYIGTLLSLFWAHNLLAETRVRLSIVDFEDKSSHSGSYEGECNYYWIYHDQSIGAAFKELLVDRLKKESEFQVLEREHIRQIYDNEHALINSEHSKKPKKGMFAVAQYTVAGVVTEFEDCSGGEGAKVDVGALVGIPTLGLGVKRSHSHVKVNIRLINVETGEILKTANGEGESSRTKVGVDTEIVRNGSFSLGGFKKTPLGTAVANAINNAADIIIESIPKS